MRFCNSFQAPLEFRTPRGWIFFSIQPLHRALSFRSRVLNFQHLYVIWVLWFFLSPYFLCLKYTCLSCSWIGFLNLCTLKASTFPGSFHHLLKFDYVFCRNVWRDVKLHQKCSRPKTEESRSKWHQKLPSLCFSVYLFIFSLLFWVSTWTRPALNHHWLWAKVKVKDLNLSFWWLCPICSADFVLVWSVVVQKAGSRASWFYRFTTTKQCWLPLIIIYLTTF